MSERLLSVGVDVGTTSTQMVLSELVIENRASAFAVPDMVITRRLVRYRSPVYFTPLLSEDLVDGPEIRKLLEMEYAAAGIRREDVDTGAIIITGETSRKENARTVLEALSDFAGDFVVATAGPDLESILAAKGAGAVAYSRQTGKTVLHMDIGGGTSNLALIRDGNILKTGCLNVGGRLIRYDKTGTVTYISPVLRELSPIKVGEQAEKERLGNVARMLARVLESAAGICADRIPDVFFTEEAAVRWLPPEEPAVLSFSGGVADCIGQAPEWRTFGDLGVLLGQAIRESSLCSGEYVLGRETIRATVIGAGSHSTQLSGSTVYWKDVQLPLKNLPVMHISSPEDIPEGETETCILAWQGYAAPTYRQLRDAAKTIASRAGGQVLLCLEQDMAKALGQALALMLPRTVPILCIDGLHLTGECYLDIGRPTAGAFPVVVKTLVMQ